MKLIEVITGELIANPAFLGEKNLKRYNSPLIGVKIIIFRNRAEQLFPKTDILASNHIPRNQWGKGLPPTG